MRHINRARERREIGALNTKAKIKQAITLARKLQRIRKKLDSLDSEIGEALDYGLNNDIIDSNEERLLEDAVMRRWDAQDAIYQAMNHIEDRGYKSAMQIGFPI